jgi:hypothetical protein
MIPDLDYPAVLNPKHVDHGDRPSSAEHQRLHPPRSRRVVPLPARGDEIAFGDLKVDRATHRAIRPEEVSDVLLCARRLAKPVDPTHVVNDILGRDQLGDGLRVRREPDLFVELTGERLVLLWILRVHESGNRGKQRHDAQASPAEGCRDLIASHRVYSGGRYPDFG